MIESVVVRPLVASSRDGNVPSSDGGRYSSVVNLVHLVARWGLRSASGVQLVMTDRGQCCFGADRFLPQSTKVLLLPTEMKLTRHKLVQHGLGADWKGWSELERVVSTQRTSPPHSDLHAFRRYCDLVVAVLGAVHKVETTPCAELSPFLELFGAWWRSLPPAAGVCLLNWSAGDLRILTRTSFYRTTAAKTTAEWEAWFRDVMSPILTKYPEQFGAVDFRVFVRVCALISSRTFSYGEEDLDRGDVSPARVSNSPGFGGATAATTGRNCMLPVLDFANGSHCGLHNCELTEVVIDGRASLLLSTTADINAGEQFILHYAQCDNAKYLLSYDYVPYRREVVTSNPDQEVRLDFQTFLCRQLRQCAGTADYYSEWSDAEIWGDVLPVLSVSVPAQLVCTQREILGDPGPWGQTLRDMVTACLVLLRHRSAPSVCCCEAVEPPTLEEIYEAFAAILDCSVVCADLAGLVAELRQLSADSPGGLLNDNVVSSLMVYLAELGLCEVLCRCIIRSSGDMLDIGVGYAVDVGYMVMRRFLSSKPTCDAVFQLIDHQRGLQYVEHVAASVGHMESGSVYCVNRL